MTISNIKANLNSDLISVWNTITSLENYHWRSDNKEIKVIEPNQVFIEYSKDGFPTKFTITKFEPYQTYEFDIENENMKGHWIGTLNESNGVVNVDFTEDIVAKKILLKPFVKAYLKKQQNLYIQDLKKALK